MAASDKTYRKQTVLHVVFAVSSLAMLVTTVWMFWDDYNRPYKKDQKVFRDVEEELARRAAIQSAPDNEAIGESIAAERNLADARTIHRLARDQAETHVGRLRAVQFERETRFANRKADYDSLMSFYNIEVEHHGPQSATARKYLDRMSVIRKDMDAQKIEIEEGQRQIDEAFKQTYTVKHGEQEVTISPEKAEKAVSVAEDKHKKLTDEFDRFMKLSAQKEWTWKDRFRMLPVIDGFASPVKIQQFTLEELPIDYSFKFVTRYDRCTTCHLGLEKASYSPDALAKLTKDPAEDADLMAKLENAKMAVKERNAILEAYNKSAPSSDRKPLLPIPADKLAPEKVGLSDAKVKMFAAHPRLDLFVDSNSPHPAEKFGCSSCHGGQGSATGFVDAVHSPNDPLVRARWVKEQNWESIHFWDFPMLPTRFAEAACVKCHHQMYDLVRDGSQVEAPKLIKGYNLVRELGCFGCHEFAGIKNGRWIGPDLRLEPDPPLEARSSEERAKWLADPANPPGMQRKVGPSLERIAEKTNDIWARQWIKEPRGFRPDTRMPHYFLQANNTPDVLPAEQKKFPDAEVESIAHYLFAKSKEVVGEIKPDAPVAANAEQLERGRHLFSTRGCLACHQHNGTAADAKPEGKPPMPSIVGDSNFGPNLSRLVSKLGVKAGDPQSSRKWLIKWLLKPSDHSARTMMPTIGLTDPEAEDIAAWLLAQPSDWQGTPVENADTGTLKALARVYLQKSLTNRQIDEVLTQDRGFTDEQLAMKATDADERLLAGSLDKDNHKLKMFVGKKAIGSLGCYGCHNIPGFKDVKPIGTGLNEWGKKDAERIAFEDADAFVKNHFNIVDVRRDLTEAEKKAGAIPWEMKGDKQPYERFYAERLDSRHHTREGFLHLKLQEPRSYDYNRIRAWDDRARMPQFKFARVKQQDGESKEAYAIRWEREEAEAREAVMTFVLGLVAEPIPARYVNSPTRDRSAEVKGRAVLEKFNCAGCHLVRPGTVDFKLTRDKFVEKEEEKDGRKVPVTSSFRDSVLSKLEKTYQDYKGRDSDYAADHRFPEHNAWAAPAQKRPDRLRLTGITYPEGKFWVNEETEEFSPTGKTLVYRLVDALHFKTLKDEDRDIPASTDVFLPREAIADMSEPLGGAFAGLLAKYLQGRDREKYSGPQNLRYSYAAGPPSLIREGEKVQPGWLYQFLLNPQPIRPLAVLRMPKFSLSDDDAMALVNYFTAVDRRTNPGIGLTGPYLTVPERDESYLAAKSREYIERLKKAGAYVGRVKQMQPVWGVVLKEKSAAADAKVVAAKAIVEEMKKKNEPTEIAQKAVEAAEAEARKLKQQLEGNDFKELQQAWETTEAYVVDAFKLTANPNLCTKCHEVGTMPVEQVQGPSLALSAGRLRPEWTRRWIANPERFQHYKSVMPQNFPANVKPNPYPESFIGTEDDYAAQQIRAVRDFLMIYPQVADWPVLKYRTATGTTGGK